ATLYSQPEMRKTDLIHSNFLILSSGTSMIERLISKNLVIEYTDARDKRSKLLKLSEEGSRTFRNCLEIVKKLAYMFLSYQDEADKGLCRNLIGSVEARYSALLHEQKLLDFDEIYRENTQESSPG